MSILWVLIAVILLLALLPAWPYSRYWGYAPTGLGGLVLVILLLVLLF